MRCRTDIGDRFQGPGPMQVGGLFMFRGRDSAVRELTPVCEGCGRRFHGVDCTGRKFCDHACQWLAGALWLGQARARHQEGPPQESAGGDAAGTS